MKMLEGLTAASGIARGIICQYLTDIEISIPHYEIAPQHVITEIERLEKAFQYAARNMQQTVQNAEVVFDKETAEIFKVHLMILENKTIKSKIVEMINARRINAEHAVKEIFDIYIDQFAKQEGHFAELKHDYMDIQKRILTALDVDTGLFQCPASERGPVIVAAQHLTPSLVMSLAPENVLAFIAEEGGLTSHAVILARSYHVPIILGVSISSETKCGMAAIVDGSLGRVFLEPDEQTAQYYDQKIAGISERKKICEVYKDLKPQTQEGERISLKINLSTPSELELLKGLPFDGIGLLRTEFLFLHRDEPPSENEQYAMYKSLLSEVKDKPVTVRLLDISQDKLPSYIRLPKRAGYDFSLRGAFAVEFFEKIFISQIKALLKANEFGNLKILYPMVSDLNDLAVYRGVIKKARQELEAEGDSRFASAFAEGIMVETPAAVLLAETLLSEVDFINIGSNDLLQYTLAAQRGNLLVENRYHILHPALVRMMQIIIKAGEKANKEVCLCGEVAAFAEFYPLLVNIGLNVFSVSVSGFDDIKCALLCLDTEKHNGIAEEFFSVKSKKEADEFFAQYI